MRAAAQKVARDKEMAKNSPYATLPKNGILPDNVSFRNEKKDIFEELTENSSNQ